MIFNHHPLLRLELDSMLVPYGIHSHDYKSKNKTFLHIGHLVHFF